MSTEDKYNPNDPEFLASRALDEPLTDAQQRILDDHPGDLATMQHTDELVQSIRDDKVDIDWATFQQTIQDRVTCQNDNAQLDRVDELVQASTQLPDSWDDQRFTQRVLQKIDSIAQPQPTRFRWMKAAVPLAAAAAIALVVTMAPWQDRPHSPTSIVSIGPAIHAGHRLPLDNAVALVSFRHEPTVVDGFVSSRSRVSFVSVGSEPIIQDRSPAPPL